MSSSSSQQRDTADRTSYDYVQCNTTLCCIRLVRPRWHTRHATVLRSSVVICWSQYLTVLLLNLVVVIQVRYRKDPHVQNSMRKLKLTLTLTLTLTDTGGAVLTLMLGNRSLYITWQYRTFAIAGCHRRYCVILTYSPSFQGQKVIQSESRRMAIANKTCVSGKKNN